MVSVSPEIARAVHGARSCEKIREAAERSLEAVRRVTPGACAAFAIVLTTIIANLPPDRNAALKQIRRAAFESSVPPEGIKVLEAQFLRMTSGLDAVAAPAGEAVPVQPDLAKTVAGSEPFRAEVEVMCRLALLESGAADVPDALLAEAVARCAESESFARAFTQAFCKASSFNATLPEYSRKQVALALIPLLPESVSAALARKAEAAKAVAVPAVESAAQREARELAAAEEALRVRARCVSSSIRQMCEELHAGAVSSSQLNRSDAAGRKSQGAVAGDFKPKLERLMMKKKSETPRSYLARLRGGHNLFDLLKLSRDADGADSDVRNIINVLPDASFPADGAILALARALEEASNGWTGYGDLVEILRDCHKSISGPLSLPA